MPTTTQPTNFHNVKIGEILIDQHHNERKVLGKTKQGLLLSSNDDFTLTDFGISFSELEELNYQLKLEKINTLYQHQGTTLYTLQGRKTGKSTIADYAKRVFSPMEMEHLIKNVEIFLEELKN